MSIVFKCMKTPKRKYVYDRNTNTVLNVTDAEYDELLEVENRKLDPIESNIVSNMQKQGVLLANRVTEIEHPDVKYLPHYVDHRLSQLILQVTQQCNLRCGYCVYSGGYANRHHANKNMSLELAKKAVDYFIKHSFENNEIFLSFYGGEPLLEISLIKKIIDYLETKIEGKKVGYNLTTNATLLTGDIVEYLVKKEFEITISLDGSKEEHDKNRKFVNGQGSFDIIMKNVKQLIEQYPAFVKRHLKFNTVISPKINVACVKEFFDTDEIMSDNYILFNTVNEKNVLENIEFNDEYYIVRKYEYLKLLLMLIKKLDSKYVSKLVLRGKDNIDLLIKSLSKHKSISAISHHNGPCIPGARRLFVTVEGDLYPCEKVSECKGDVCIGKIDQGIELEKVSKMMNIGKLTKENCLECWYLPNCSMCVADCEVNGIISKQQKVVHCNRVKKMGLLNILEVCALKEFGYMSKEV